MCGIIGILGKSDVQDRIVDGLSRLEYRGYDSAGVAILSGAKVTGCLSRSSFDDFLSRKFSIRDRCRSTEEFGKVFNC